MKHGVVRGWRQWRDKLKAPKKKYSEVVDGLRLSVVNVESGNDTIYRPYSNSSQLAVQVHESNSADTKVLLE